MNPNNESGGLFSAASARAAGIFLMLLGVVFSAAANRQTPAWAPGLLVCGVLFFLASTRAARKLRFLPMILILAGIAACGAMMLR